MSKSINPLIEERRAKRALSSEPVAKEDVDTLIEAAHLAPSCFNSQPWRFVIADDEEKLAAIKEALPGGNYWAKPAPVLIAVCSHRDLDCKLSDGRDYFLLGCGMALGTMMIQATQMGLIAHPIAGYKPPRVKEILEIPEEYTLITLVIVGYPGDASQLSDKHRAVELGPRERNPISQVTARNKFRFPSTTDE